MILETLDPVVDRTLFSYAVLLIADYHLEYPLEATGGGSAEVVWNPFQLTQIAERLGCDTTASDEFVYNLGRTLFPRLEEDYNGHGTVEHNLWRVQGNPQELTAIFNNHAQALMGGPPGADDDTYDYWPNAFDMLVTMAEDLINLGVYRGTDWVSRQVRRVVWSAIAVQGPPEQWEAEGIVGAANNIAAMEAKANESRDPH